MPPLMLNELVIEHQWCGHSTSITVSFNIDCDMVFQDMSVNHLSNHPAKGDGQLSSPQLYWRFSMEKRMRLVG
jgi:hypothetical protein